jgi:hypothetical protein
MRGRDGESTGDLKGDSRSSQENETLKDKTAKEIRATADEDQQLIDSQEKAVIRHEQWRMRCSSGGQRPL